MLLTIRVERAGAGHRLVNLAAQQDRPYAAPPASIAATYETAENKPSEIRAAGRELFDWLNGKEGWLRDPQFAEDAEPCLRLDVADASELAVSA